MSLPVFEISRVFAAPRPLVWACFTDPARMAQWWGPKGLTIGHSVMDLRVGGMYHYSMLMPDGTAMWGRQVYREIEPPHRLHFVNSFSDEKAGVTRHPLAPSWPLEMLCTFTLSEVEGGTLFKVESSPLNASAEEIATFAAGFASMTGGWGGTLDKLADYLPSA